MQGDTDKYNKSLSAADIAICDLLGERQTEKYRRMGPLSRPLIRSGQWSQTTTGISQPAARLSGTGLKAEGSFKAAEARYTAANQVDRQSLKRWLEKARDIQCDYKNIVRRKGKLERLK